VEQEKARRDTARQHWRARGSVPGRSHGEGLSTDARFARLTGRWRTLQHITASPGKIGDIARAALGLAHFERGYIT
jgi:hypothetical protein